MDDLLSRSLMKAEQSEARNTRAIIMEHKWYIKDKTQCAEIWVTGQGAKGANLDRLTSYCLTSLQG